MSDAAQSMSVERLAVSRDGARAVARSRLSTRAWGAALWAMATSRWGDGGVSRSGGSELMRQSELGWRGLAGAWARCCGRCRGAARCSTRF